MRRGLITISAQPDNTPHNARHRWKSTTLSVENATSGVSLAYIISKANSSYVISTQDVARVELSWTYGNIMLKVTSL